jgi:spoIIIJ-associated protein
VDERRHNMDGALFVDEERAGRASERPVRPRTYDDGKAEAARRVTQGILDRMDLEASVEVREDDERIVLDIDGPDAGRAIGKKGMTLEALQFLVNKIVNRDPEERRHVVLDSGDYRERHDNGLVSMAKREAKRAVTSGRAVTLEPMSARDRRVIHVSLAKFPGVSTRSEGEGMERRLQIIPARGERGRDDRGSRDDRDRPRTAARDDRDRPRPAARDDRDRPRAAARDDRPRPAARAERATEGEPRRERATEGEPRRERATEGEPRRERATEGEPRREREVGPRELAPREPSTREAPAREHDAPSYERERDYTDAPRPIDRDSIREYDRAPGDRGRGR